jgi:CHASE2 domain-containing sensor protein
MKKIYAMMTALTIPFASLNAIGFFQSRDVSDPEQVASGEIVLIAIDEESLVALGPWPWPRSQHAALQNAATRAGVDQTIFDIEFSTESRRQDDEKFAEAIKAANGRTTLVAIPSKQRGDHPREPIQALKAVARQAAGVAVPDDDGIIRYLHATYLINGKPIPVLAAAIAKNYAPKGSIRVGWNILPNTVPRYSAHDLIAGRVPREAIYGKTVVIGATAESLGDRHPSPHGGNIPGVMIHILAAEASL